MSALISASAAVPDDVGGICKQGQNKKAAKAMKIDVFDQNNFGKSSHCNNKYKEGGGELASVFKFSLVRT